MVFKRAPHLPFEQTAVRELGKNAIVIRVQPDEGVTMRFGAKVPGGSTMEVRDVNMDFSYGRSFTENSPEAYERLILDVLLGDPPLFPTTEEVNLSWEILDPIERFWSTLGQPQAIPLRHVGPGTGRRNAGARRTPLEDAMIIDMPNTRTREIAHKIEQLHEERGESATGRVLTLLIATEDADLEHALEIANSASREHPCRVIAVVPDTNPADQSGEGEPNAAEVAAEVSARSR